MKRTAAISMAALLSVGGATAALASTAGAVGTDPSSPTTSIDPTTPTTAPAVPPEVTGLSITLAGLGDISLSVDPVTHEISNIVVTPIDGVTATDPVVVRNGIQLQFTLTDGTVRSIVVEVEGHHGQVRLEVEDEESDDDHGDGPPPIAERGRSADHRNDQHDRHGPDVTTPPTTAPTAPGTSVTPSVNSGRSLTDSTEREDSSSDSSRSGRSGSRD